MKSGRHAHYCPTCAKDKDCEQITHCKRPDTTPCIDCRAATFANERAEEGYYETGKWPWEAK